MSKQGREKLFNKNRRYGNLKLINNVHTQLRGILNAELWFCRLVYQYVTTLSLFGGDKILPLTRRHDDYGHLS